MKDYFIFVFVVLIFHSVCDKIDDNENKITIIAKELRSLHERVESKITTLQEEIERQRSSDEGHRYYQMRKLFRSFQDMKFQFLTLKLDIRQLFYAGVFLKREMGDFVENKTQGLENQISELRAAIKRINKNGNISEADMIDADKNNIGHGNEGSVIAATTPSVKENKDPLQDMEISMEVGKKFTIPCELEGENRENNFHWFRNGRRLTSSTSKRYIIRYSASTKVSTFTIPNIQPKDFGILECKDDDYKVILRIHLYVKEPCKDFLCDGTCVEMSKVCDGISDCSRRQDEGTCELIADILRGEVRGRGTVVVLINKMKGRVCSEGWDDSAADVLCRQLRYRTGEQGPPISHSMEKGFLVSHINCTGTETQLSECKFGITNVASCTQFASVLCV